MWFHSSKITFHSRASSLFFRSLGAPQDRFEYIPSGLDAQRFSTAQITPAKDVFSSSEDTTRLLCVARLHPYKGIRFLLDAMAISIRQGLQLELRVIGRGGLEATLREKVRQLHLDNAVSLLTVPIPNDRMPSVYPACDIYVQPSVVEPFGTAVAEAMASGKPVIGSKVGGIQDLVSDGETGLLVPPGDSAGIAKAIRTLAMDPSLRLNMGFAARERANSVFDYRVQSRQYEALMNDAKRSNL